MGATYAEAGVDIDAEGKAISAIVEEVKKTLRFRRGKEGEGISISGHFSGLVRIGPSRALALTSDGVGSKIMVAEQVGRYDTLGMDLVAMNVNDIICVGAEPLAMVDYLAMEAPNPGIVREIAKGLVRGAELAGITIAGGELATLPEMVKGFDIAGFALGIVELDKLVTGEDIAPGDIVVGLESSGIHSNGLTLARKLLLDKYGGDAVVDGVAIGEELLRPTKIYVPEVMGVLKKVEVKGMANITGGGLGNLTRITKYGFFIDSLPEPQPIFKLIQREGDVSDSEMYRTFNMGTGFCIVVPQEKEEEVIDVCLKHGTKAWALGKVDRGEGVRFKDKDFILRYQG
jgi:phosphoribosylformylglycinamidine cyclo-ligase